MIITLRRRSSKLLCTCLYEKQIAQCPFLSSLHLPQSRQEPDYKLFTSCLSVCLSQVQLQSLTWETKRLSAMQTAWGRRVRKVVKMVGVGGCVRVVSEAWKSDEHELDRKTSLCPAFLLLNKVFSREHMRVLTTSVLE